MAKRKTRQGARQRAGGAGTESPKRKPIESYDHKDKKRANNPPAGLVTPETDPDAGQRTTYQYDPHLVWAGKAEQTSLEVPTVSLHVHERIDPRTIIEATRRRNGNGGNGRILSHRPPAGAPRPPTQSVGNVRNGFAVR